MLQWQKACSLSENKGWVPLSRMWEFKSQFPALSLLSVSGLCKHPPTHPHTRGFPLTTTSMIPLMPNEMLQRKKTGAAELTLYLYLLQSLKTLCIPPQVPWDARRQVCSSAREFSRTLSSETAWHTLFRGSSLPPACLRAAAVWY